MIALSAMNGFNGRTIRVCDDNSLVLEPLGIWRVGVGKTTTDPDWRSFEKLVALIERTLSPSGAVVKSPDKITDLFTGQSREVDASIRYRIGSVPILITVECRLRSRAQDDTWIEQLAKKKEKIGAAKTIAVSSKGFSAQALRTAELTGIEARTIEEITREDVAKWCELDCIHYVPPSIKILEIHFYDDKWEHVSADKLDDSIHESLRSSGTRAPIVQCGGESITPDDIVQSWQNQFRGTERDLNHGVQVGAGPVRKGIRIPVPPGEYWLSSKQGKLFIRGVILIVEVEIQLQLIPINHAYRYQTSTETVVDGVEFVIPEFDPKTKMPLRVLLQKGEEFGFKATLMLEDEAGPNT